MKAVVFHGIGDIRNECIKRWAFLIMLGLALALSGCGVAGEAEGDAESEQVLPGEGVEGGEGLEEGENLEEGEGLEEAEGDS